MISSVSCRRALPLPASTRWHPGAGTVSSRSSSGKHPAGLCTGQLFELQPGDTVNAFLRQNPGFHAGCDAAPLILVGAGTGIGPLAGFIRANARRRPIRLFFGMRHPDSDFLYGEELEGWRRNGQLQRLDTACSRTRQPSYVQMRCAGRASRSPAWFAKVRGSWCGGREMAAGVSAVLAEIPAPTGLTPTPFRAEGRYVEDVF